MKRLLTITFVLMALFSMSFAQQIATTTSNVTANVNAVLTITNTGALNLGNVAQGSTVTITSLTAGAATFTVQGAASAAATITVTNPVNLSDGTNNIPFTGQIPRYNIVNVQGSSTAFVALTGGSTSTNASGQLFLWVGGSVTAAVAQPAGSYTGVITVQVTQP